MVHLQTYSSINSGLRQTLTSSRNSKVALQSGHEVARVDWVTHANGQMKELDIAGLKGAAEGQDNAD